MNTIQQKRIEEAAKFIAVKNAPVIGTRLYDECCYNSCIEAATFALQNQWISVDEALPEVNKNTKLSDKCFIARKGKFGCPDWFGDGYYDKDMGWINHGERISNITYWMPIPQI